MRTGTIILALLLAGGLAATANAVDLTITLELDSQTVDPGEFVGFTIYAEVTNNNYDFGWGDTYIFDGGIQGWLLDVQFSQPGKIKLEEGKGPPPQFLPNGKPKVAINTGVFSFEQPPAYSPNGGGNNAGASQPLLPADRWVNPWPTRYSIGNGDVGTRVELMSGRIEGVASGPVDITIGDFAPSTMYLYILDEAIGITTMDIVAESAPPPGDDPIPPQDHHIYAPGYGLPPVPLVVTGVGGNPPSADAGPDLGENDWSGPPPWNADGRQITVTGVGEDNDGDTQALTFEWMIEDHTGAQYGPLVDEGMPPPGEQNTITFSIGQLRGLGFPLPDPLGGPRDQYLYPLHLTVTDPDGSATDTAQIYIPEPGTMALLGLGALALIRRRRQA